jgi:hypothetical protein
MRYFIATNSTFRKGDKPAPSLVRTLVYTMRRQEPFMKAVFVSDGSKILYSLHSLEEIVATAGEQ